MTDRRGSVGSTGSNFLGTINASMAATSDHVSIVDETDDSDDELNDLEDSTHEVVTPAQAHNIAQDQPRRRGRSGGPRSRSPPHASNSTSSRFRRTSHAPSASASPHNNRANTNLWQSRQETAVDQSVNLMAAGLQSYGETTSATSTAATSSSRRGGGRPGMSSIRQKSMVDIFLSSDEPQSRGGAGSTRHSEYGLHDTDGTGGRVRKWRMCLLFVVAVVVIAILAVAVPQFGLVHSMSNNNDNNDKEKKTNPPTKSPTKSPTQSPKEEPQELIEEEVQLPDNVEPPKPPPQEDRPLPEPETPITEETLQDQGETLDLENVPHVGRLKAFQFYVVDQDVTDQAQLDDANSPANKALHWITQKDPAQLEIPGLDGNIQVSNAQAEYALLQRYALAVFFFSQQAASTSANNDNAGRKQRQLHLRALQQNNNNNNPDKSDALSNRQKFDNTWLSANPICMWHGVTCAEDFESVQQLSLDRHLLQGTLPRELLVGSAMPFLTHVDVSDNQLHGPLPVFSSERANAGQQLGVTPRQSQLRVLRAGGNQLSGKLDVITAGFPQLRQLHIANNQVTGAIPENIQELTLLDALDLSGNKLSQSLPAQSLEKLTRLRILNLAGNDLTGDLPGTLSALTNLEVLSLASNKLQGTIPEGYGDLTNLEKLDLDGNGGITKTVPTQLGNLVKLWRLQLDGNNLSGEMPAQVCALRNAASLRFLEADCTSGDIKCDCCTECF